MESGVSLSTLTALVMRYFRSHARKYDLNPAALSVRYILNWGGFVNASFAVQDEKRAYHLKLADADDTIASLDRWYGLRNILQARYRAPTIVDWIEIDDTPCEGLLFDFFEGRKADFRANPSLHRQVLDLVGHLHADQELADILTRLDGPPGDCADYFMSTYIDRFDEDLLSVVRDLPSFVSLSTLDWMQGETRHLESLARELPAFTLPANAPTHGDLWENNVLVNDRGEWIIIDWDDLSLGDPALEYSILISMLWRQNPEHDLSGASLLPAGLQLDSALKDRLAVCMRAFLLDEVIDSLADYVESEYSPAHRDQVQEEKKRIHMAALEKYRQIYD